MDTNSLAIVCYTGGTCGDLISAMIDYHDATFTVFKTVKHADRRQRLKKPHLFTTTEEKNQYLVEVAQQYNSIPSHDLDYHVQQQHKFISIIVEDATVAQWAANRFKLNKYHINRVFKRCLWYNSYCSQRRGNCYGYWCGSVGDYLPRKRC